MHRIKRSLLWFHRYIRSCSNKQLEKLLRFITASSSLPCDTKIKIQFVNQPKYLRPHAQTCFKILLIPRQYAPFTQLYANFNFYMRIQNTGAFTMRVILLNYSLTWEDCLIRLSTKTKIVLVDL